MERVADCAENITLHGKDLNELPGALYRRIIEQGNSTSPAATTCASTSWRMARPSGRHAAPGAAIGRAGGTWMAFGDNSNDIGMLTWAGVGVAMGNAPDFVKRAADQVTLPNTQAGFAKVVRALLQ